MFDNELFEVAIVVVVVLAALSLFVDSISKALLAITGWRRRLFQRMIFSLLSDDTYGTIVAQRFLRHPVVRGPASSGRDVRIIDDVTFVVGLASAISPDPQVGDAQSGMRNSIASMKEGKLKRRLSLVTLQASTDEDVEQALRQWFTSSLQATEQQFGSDLRATYWIVAAVCTVLINVSPLEIIERTTAKETLRTIYSAVVPEVAPMLYDSSEPSNGSGGDATVSQGMKAEDVKQIYTFYQCAQSGLGLPIGWAWMAGAADELKKTAVGNKPLGSDEAVCQRVLDLQSTSASDSALMHSIQKLGSSGALNFNRQYGPSFESDNPLTLLFGWLLSTMIAATAAPSASELLQRYLRR